MKGALQGGQTTIRDIRRALFSVHPSVEKYLLKADVHDTATGEGRTFCSTYDFYDANRLEDYIRLAFRGATLDEPDKLLSLAWEKGHPKSNGVK